MRRFDEVLPYIVVAIVGVAAFFVGDYARKGEVADLQAKVIAFQARPDAMPVPIVAETSDCTAAIEKAERERDMAITMANRYSTRMAELDGIVDDLAAQVIALNQQNLKPAEPEHPKPGARVLDLPEDANTWYSSLFVQPDYATRPNEAAAVRRLNETDWGRDLQARTHFRLLKTTDAEARRYWQFVPQTPCLMIQKPDGQVVYREVNPDLSKDQGGLRRHIDRTMKRQRHHNMPFCPGPNCPIDQSNQGAPPANEVVVDPAQPAEPPPNHLPAILAALGAGGVTYALKFGAAAHKAGS